MRTAWHHFEPTALVTLTASEADPLHGVSTGTIATGDPGERQGHDDHVLSSEARIWCQRRFRWRERHHAERRVLRRDHGASDTGGSGGGQDSRSSARSSRSLLVAFLPVFTAKGTEPIPLFGDFGLARHRMCGLLAPAALPGHALTGRRRSGRCGRSTRATSRAIGTTFSSVATYSPRRPGPGINRRNIANRMKQMTSR